jgi:hypothetical protein
VWVKYNTAPTDGFIVDYWGNSAETLALTEQNQGGSNFAVNYTASSAPSGRRRLRPRTPRRSSMSSRSRPPAPSRAARRSRTTPTSGSTTGPRSTAPSIGRASRRPVRWSTSRRGR